MTDIKELYKVLKYEKERYFPSKPHNGFYFLDCFVHEEYQLIWKYQKLLRKTEYLYNKRKNPFLRPWCYIYNRRKNALGAKLGIEISKFSFGKGLLIDHCAGIVVNGNCRIGENCRLHGANCIGNKGVNGENEFPTIGNGVDIGYGAVIIGKITIADGVTIGANSVVTKSIEEAGAIFAGNPARKINA